MIIYNNPIDVKGDISLYEPFLINLLSINPKLFESYDKSERNWYILDFVRQFAPKKIFEFACCAGFLAKLILENIPTIEKYLCCNYSPTTVNYTKKQLCGFSNCIVEELDVNVVRNIAFNNRELNEYDCFISTSLAHIEHEIELIKKIPSNSFFIFNVGNSVTETTYFAFENYVDIIEKYKEYLQIIEIIKIETCNINFTQKKDFQYNNISFIVLSKRI